VKTIVVSTLGRGSISTFSKQSLPLQSAGEMIAAFAKENNLVTIVGTATAGRLLSGSVFKFGHGYLLGLPVAAYLTWQGALLEG
jgi:C-terminal processing protease CtpA/Prc